MSTLEAHDIMDSEHYSQVLCFLTCWLKWPSDKSFGNRRQELKIKEGDILLIFAAIQLLSAWNFDSLILNVKCVTMWVA
jgi:hypothetical protein